jgi:branched-subunit amino acid aminotransferase/4-amino-4-deoxychorismate lyase
MSLPLYVSRNGELIAPADARVSIFNPALSGSYGVYESLQIVRGAPFAQRAHLERLARSAALLDLPLPADLPTFERWIAEVIGANAAQEGVLRLYVLGPENGGAPTAFIWPQPFPVYPAEFYTHGATAITFEGERTLPAAKSLNTLVSFLAQRQARAAGVHEALLYHDGHLTEGSNSNLFAMAAGAATGAGAILTAPADQVLSGVARDIVLHLATTNHIALAETTLVLADVPRWTECFITSTSRHVLPITSIDGHPVGNGQVGPQTRRMMALFEEYFVQKVTANAQRQKTR